MFWETISIGVHVLFMVSTETFFVAFSLDVAETQTSICCILCVLRYFGKEKVELVSFLSPVLITSHTMP